MTDKNSRRSGGRNARRAARAAPLSKELQPVRAGMESNTYRPLTEAGEKLIHSAALDALENYRPGRCARKRQREYVEGRCDFWR